MWIVGDAAIEEITTVGGHQAQDHNLWPRIVLAGMTGSHPPFSRWERTIALVDLYVWLINHTHSQLAVVRL